MTRTLQALRALSSVAAPGLAQALAARSRSAALFALSGALVIIGTGLGTALVACTCPLVAGAIVFAALGVTAALHDVWATRRATRGLGAARPTTEKGERSLQGAPTAPSRAPLLAHAGIVVLLPLLAFAATRAAVIDLYFVPSASMAPTLRAGDTIFVSHLAALERGSVAVFRGERDRLYVKRIAAVAGDRVEVRHGELWLNGEHAPLFIEHTGEDPLAGRYYTRTGERSHRVLFQSPYLARPSLFARVVPRGHVFVLGDNRDHSDDSRSFGFVSESALIGRAFALGPHHGEEGTSWNNAGLLL